MTKRISESAMLQEQTEILRGIVKAPQPLKMRLTEPAPTTGNIGFEEMLQRADALATTKNPAPLPFSDTPVVAKGRVVDSESQESVEGVEIAELDPALVGPSKWANRSEDSFTGPKWEEFKEEIRTGGGNKQPIKVRRVRSTNTHLHHYEIIFGHRRHRACKELGLSVLAFIEDATDTQLFEEMDRENRGREDLSVYDQGEMYRKGLDGGLYQSLRQLSKAVCVSPGYASEAVAVARLPRDVLDAFESRNDIQLRWGAAITKELQKDPESVLTMAKAIQEERGKGGVVKSAAVFMRLTSIGAVIAKSETRPVKLPGGRTMTVTSNGKRLKLVLNQMDAKTAKLVEKAIVDALKE